MKQLICRGDARARQSQTESGTEGQMASGKVSMVNSVGLVSKLHVQYSQYLRYHDTGTETRNNTFVATL